MLDSQRQRLMSRATASLEALFPTTIRVGDDETELAAARSSVRSGSTLEAFGFRQQAQVSFRVRKALLPVPPGSGIGVFDVGRSQSFAVVRVQDGGGADSAWLIVCEAPAQ